MCDYTLRGSGLDQISFLELGLHAGLIRQLVGLYGRACQGPLACRGVLGQLSQVLVSGSVGVFVGVTFCGRVCPSGVSCHVCVIYTYVFHFI